MDKPSPLPWHVEIDSAYPDEVQGIYSGKERVVETDSGYYPPRMVDANLIVESVNNYAALQKSHAELMEALMNILEDCSMNNFDQLEFDPKFRERGKEALRRAQEVK